MPQLFKKLVINSFISVCCIVNREGCSFCLVNCFFVILILTSLLVPIIFFFPFCIVSAFYTKINVVIKRLGALVLPGHFAQ